MLGFVDLCQAFGEDAAERLIPVQSLIYFFFVYFASDFSKHY